MMTKCVICGIRFLAIAGALVCAMLMTAHMAKAQTTTATADKMVVSGLNDQGEVNLTVNKSTIVATGRPQKRVSVAEPSIVDVNGISPTRILLTAKKPGSTQIIIWDEQDRSQTIDVTVSADIAGLRSQLAKFNGSQIEATTAEDAVVLRGRASNLEASEQAVALAAGYGKRVANFIEIAGGQQVQLQVRVAEISKSAVRQLGVNFAYNDGVSIGGSNVGGIAPFGFRDIGSAGDLALGVPLTPSSNVTLFGKGQIGNTAFAVFISALRDNNLLRILAEPNLVAMSGQEASFLAGGEFPIPVPQSGSGNDTTITIAYREFGVKLNFTPIVLGSGKIRLRVAPEVSDLDFTTAVRFGGFVVPGLTQRKVTTTVELNDGQTLAIAGLLNQSVTVDRNVTPLLGDIPVIGALFRSIRYQRKETELVIFVTPKVVAPMSPGQVPPLPGEVWRHPNDLQLYGGADMGGPVAGSRTVVAPRYMGEYGFVAADASAAKAAPATQPSN
ncbi:MAG: type II and III secretion system protein family protein [Anaerolineae bacterium]|nr:type II and III secretion system protein family protein [Phycisphaerae bacterium]